MKKITFLKRSLLLVFALMTMAVSRLSAAESRGDTLFNEADAEVQVLINEIYRTSQYYNYIPVVDHYLDALAEEGATSSKQISAKRDEAQNVLKQQLQDLYDKRFAARSEYENQYTKYFTEGNLDALEILERDYKAQVAEFDNQEAAFRAEYDKDVTSAAENLWSLYNSLTLELEETKADILVAEEIYQECLEAEELLFKATDAQKNSQAGRELQSSINDARGTLNGETFDADVFAKLLESLLQYMESFTQETTAISAPLLSESRADVHAINGTLLLRSVTRAEAARKLPAGLYLFDGKKVCFR